MLFSPEDFVVEERHTVTTFDHSGLEHSDSYIFKGFIQTAKHCKERLEIFGMTSFLAKKDFNRAKKLSREYLKELSISDIRLGGFTYSSYLQQIQDIVQANDTNYNTPLNCIRDILIREGLAIFGQDARHHIYSVLSIFPDDATVEYDLTDVINEGYINEEAIKSFDNEKIIVLTEGKTDVEFIS